MTTNHNTMLGTTACFAYCLLLLHTCPAVSMAESSATSSAAEAETQLVATVNLASDLASDDEPAEEEVVFPDAEDDAQGAEAATRAGIAGADTDGGRTDEDGDGEAGPSEGGLSEQEPSEAGLSETSSGKRRRRGKPLVGSASMQATLDVMEDTPYCTKCSYPIEEILRAKLYGKQSGCPSFICRGCNCVIAMVGKHMDLDTLALKGMSFVDLQGTTQGEEFFRQAQQAADQHGRLVWSQIRELLVTAMTERRLKSVKVKFTDKELPLSVWATQGYKVEELIKYGCKVDHPVFSDVYKAPLKETTRADVMHP